MQNKHIPTAYLRGSEEQRRALLAGLLDTDGHCTKAGTVEFAVTCERLARDTFHLVASLGYKPTLRTKPARLYKKECGTAWTVAFTPPDKVFRLPRKTSRQVTEVRETGKHRYITDIRPVTSVPVRCIAVDSPNHLFLVGEACIPTHNSIGGAWNILAEIVTRLDAAVIAIDITKGDQTLGPLRPALHKLVTEKKAMRKLIAQLHSAVRPRTDFLAANGYQKWVPGCGLMFLVVWIEEFPDVGDALSDKDMEQFLSFVKACRSAGIYVVLSLQRSDYTQMPTLARGQLGKMCFGVATAEDAGFGLSDAQMNADASPELWENTRPGMAYLGAPSIPAERIAMPLRTYAWGMTDQEANANMRAHAEQYPASLRPFDEVTARYLTLDMEDDGGTAPVLGTPSAPDGSGSSSAQAQAAATTDDDDPLVAEAIELVTAFDYASPEMLARKMRLGWDDAMALLRKLQARKVVRPREDGTWAVLSGDDDSSEEDETDEGDPVAEYVKTEDPSPEIQAGPNDPIENEPGDQPFEFERPINGRKVDKAAAQQMLHDQIAQWRTQGRERFATKDLRPIWEAAGWSRQWIIGQLNDLMDDGEIERDDEASDYVIRETAGVA